MPKTKTVKAAPKPKPAPKSALRATNMRASNPIITKAVAARKGAKKK